MIVVGRKVPTVSFTGTQGDTLREVHTIENLLWHWATTGIVRRVKNRTVNAAVAESVAAHGPHVPVPRDQCWYWTMDMDFETETETINRVYLS